MREAVIAANWKMHTTPSDVRELHGRSRHARQPGLRRAICPPFCSPGRGGRLRLSADPDVAVGAQNVHHVLAGAYTGKVWAPMLDGLATWVIVGHSERRRDAGETDVLIGRKLGRAMDAGLRPILCVGEHFGGAGGRGGDAGRRATGGVGISSGHDVDSPAGRGMVIAYEPVWAIGTGATRPVPTPPRWRTPSARASACWAGIELLPPCRSCTAGASPRANIHAFLAEPSIDGALVGGAGAQARRDGGI